MTDTNRMVISKHVKFDEGVVLDVLNSANATIGRQAEFTDTSNIDLEGSSVSASGSTEKPKNKPSRGKNPKGTKPGPKRGEHTMKYSKHDIITKTEKVSTTSYINSRMDSLDGLTIEEALAKTYPDSKGSRRKYRKGDLHYDLKHGYINIQSAPVDTTVEQMQLDKEVVMEVTNEINKRDGEVAIQVSLPDGDFEVLVTTDEKKFTRNSPEPKNLQEAMAMPDSQMWKDAVIKELTSLRDMGMAGWGNNPVQVFRTLRDLHWEVLRLWTGFELPSSWSALPCYGANRKRNILVL